MHGIHIGVNSTAIPKVNDAIASLALVHAHAAAGFASEYMYNQQTPSPMVSSWVPQLPAPAAHLIAPPAKLQSVGYSLQTAAQACTARTQPTR